MLNKLLIPVFICFTLPLLTSCERNQDEDAEIDLDTEIALVEVQLEKSFASIDDIADQAELGNTITKKTTEINDILNGCATVTKDTTVGPTEDTVRIIVDFGNVNCEGDDGSMRRGKVHITSLIDQVTSLRSERKVETEDYYVNNDHIDIERKLDYKGLDSQNNHKWEVTMDASITLEDGRNFTRNIAQTRVWTEGANTPLDWTDDGYTIEGSQSGTRADGRAISITTTQTLKVKTNCPNILSGEIRFVTEGKPDFSINYGDGECDNIATGTSQGETWTITL